MMKRKQILLSGAIMGALAVAIGAFGAHALKNILVQHGRTDTYELAVRYHFYHALALLLMGAVAPSESKNYSLASLLILVGLIFFSGSLYWLAVTNNLYFVYITPIGGVLMLSGWIAFAYALWASPHHKV